MQSMYINVLIGGIQAFYS